MTTLADLAKPSPTQVKLEGGKIDVFPLSLGSIASLLASHPALIAGFTSKNPDIIVAAILKTGESAVNDLIDAATKSEPGTAANVSLSAVDEAEILLACVDSTIPKDEERLGKFLAQLDALLSRLGLNGEETE